MSDGNGNGDGNGDGDGKLREFMEHFNALARLGGFDGTFADIVKDFEVVADSIIDKDIELPDDVKKDCKRGEYKGRLKKKIVDDIMELIGSHIAASIAIAVSSIGQMTKNEDMLRDCLKSANEVLKKELEEDE